MKLATIVTVLRAAVLAAALFLLGGLIPILGGLLILCAPVPLLVATLGHERARLRLAGALALTLVLIAGVAGIVQLLSFALTLGLATVVMFILLEGHRRFEEIVLLGAAAMAVAGGAAVLLWAGSPAVVAANLHTALSQSMDHANSFYRKLGLNLDETRAVSTWVVSQVIRLAPALAALLAALAVLLNLALVWRLAGKSGLGYDLFSELNRWHSPEGLIWGLLVTGFGLFVPNPEFKLVATNGLVLVSAIYFCQGLAIMAYYFQRLGMPLPARGMIYMITLIQPILAGVVCLAGIFDLWIDFRRLKPPSQEAGSFDDFF